jgi:ribosomal protein S18 acetylase RimI-like enzyme
MLTIRPFQDADAAAVVELWQRCELVRPQNDPWKDIRRKARVRPEFFRVGLVEEHIVATIMVGYDGHRGWINYLAVSPEFQRRGYGGQLMAEAERLLRTEGCPKVNLMVRTSNRAVVAFYRALGYSVDEVVSLGKRLEHDGDPNPASRGEERR